jgi:hypothetical protein
MEGKLSEADKEKLSKTVEDALVWLDDHHQRAMLTKKAFQNCRRRSRMAPKTTLPLKRMSTTPSKRRLSMWRNELEAFLYNQKNYINDFMEGKLSEADKEKFSKTVEDALVWLEDHPAAGKDEYDAKPKEIEHVAE